MRGARARLDPWLPFALFCLAGGVLLIVVPQLWILTASLVRPGGSFTVEVGGGRLASVRTNVAEFEITEETGSRLEFTRTGGTRVTLRALDAERLAVDVQAGSAPEFQRSGANKVTAVLPSMQLSITQKPTLDIFNQAAVRPRSLDVRPESGGLLIEHAPEGFLSFTDERLVWSLANYARFFAEPKYRAAVRNSLIVTALSTVLAALMAVPLAWLVARYRLRYRALIISLVTMASVSPPFLGAYAWRMLLGSGGLLTQALGVDWTIVGLHGIVWVIVWLVFPVIFLMSLASFSTLDPSLRESSLSLGASRFRTLVAVEIPLCLPGVVTGMYMAALAAFSDFGTPFIISLDVEILPKLVYTEFLNEVGGNASIASTGGVVMVALASGLLALQRVLLATRSFASVSARRSELQPPSNQVRWLTYGLAAVMLGLAFLPHATVFITSFLEWRVGVVTAVPTLRNYAEMFDTQWTSIVVSLTTAGAATLLSFVFGIGIAYVIVRRRFPVVNPLLNGLVMVPYIIPGTVFAIGFILMFNSGPVVLTGTWTILALSYFVRLLPLSVKTGEAALYQAHPALEEAAVSLGARPARVFLGITVPLMLAGAVTGMSLVFLHAVTEISSTILLYRPPWKPIAAVIFENSVTPGSNFGVAAALTGADDGHSLRAAPRAHATPRAGEHGGAMTETRDVRGIGLQPDSHGQPAVHVDGVTVRFGEFEALKNAHIHVEKGELFTLLGPSGCGKTTLLRAIAGFNTVASGRIRLDGRDVTHVPPWSRDIGFVFQNYALWPTKTIFENVAYGLRVRKVPADRIRERVARMLTLVELEHSAQKHPGELSGGMQQRAALARALVIDPPVLLLDEPLSNLDAKLRVSLRREIRHVQRQLGIAAVYVTHDQEEALDISDRVAVMNSGEIVQVGAPRAMYEAPRTTFVADFIGKACFIAGRAVGDARFRLSNGREIDVPLVGDVPRERAVCGFVRPEDVAVVAAGTGHLDATVVDVSYLGNLSRATVTWSDDERLLVEMREPPNVGDRVGPALPEADAVRHRAGGGATDHVTMGVDDGDR